jgi:ADP-ribosylglycohydrolase
MLKNMFLAGWVADAAGAGVEFLGRVPTREEVYEAMHMDGPSRNVFHGQYTDDSEMEIALLQGIIDGMNGDEFPIDHIARRYIEWANSDPLDKGCTTSDALDDAENVTDIHRNVFKNNKKSESNGSLMRCVPLAAVLDHDADMLQAAEAESSLTHFSPVIHWSTGIYCVILRSILEYRMKKRPVDVYKILQKVNGLCAKNKTVHEWFALACSLVSLNDNYSCMKNIGHAKHAFVMVIYFLRNIEKYTYEKAIFEVLSMGGDTDTNAKIVGSMFGAYYPDCIPDYMLEPVLNFDCSTMKNLRYRRPYTYSIKNALSLIDQIE